MSRATSSMIGTVILFRLLIFAFLGQQSDSFHTKTIPSFHQLQPTTMPLFAKPKPPTKTNGSGFGSLPTGGKLADNKLRSMSGFQGAGTKPLRLAANTFDTLRQTYGIAACSDVYVRSPDNDPQLFWFVGKVARCTKLQALKGTSIPTPDEAVISQKRLILEYAKRELRPQNLGGPFAKALELWLAPGDSEMDCVQNRITLKQVTGSAADLSMGFSVADVGYNPEIYLGDETTKGGLRILRDNQGRPIKLTFDSNLVD